MNLIPVEVKAGKLVTKDGHALATCKKNDEFKV